MIKPTITRAEWAWNLFFKAHSYLIDIEKTHKWTINTNSYFTNRICQSLSTLSSCVSKGCKVSRADVSRVPSASSHSQGKRLPLHYITPPPASTLTHNRPPTSLFPRDNQYYTVTQASNSRQQRPQNAVQPHFCHTVKWKTKWKVNSSNNNKT